MADAARPRGFIKHSTRLIGLADHVHISCRILGIRINFSASSASLADAARRSGLIKLSTRLVNSSVQVIHSNDFKLLPYLLLYHLKDALIQHFAVPRLFTSSLLPFLK
jgi:hypothetical protein